MIYNRVDKLCKLENDMNRLIKKFNGSIRTALGYLLYLSIMFTFVMVLGENTVGLSRLSRTMGITISTFTVVGVLFLQVYGTYDIGRRKSKPIVHSLILASICTDVVTYLQVMIMRTTANDIRAFRLYDWHLLIVIFAIQLIIIIGFVYVGNWVFFAVHPPEECIIITSSQESLDFIVKAMKKYKKQYRIRENIDYNDPLLYEHILNRDTVFIYDVPVTVRAEIMRHCYKQKVNVYFNPDVEDVMETNAEKYILDDVYLLNKNVKALTMEQRILKRLMDLTASIIGGIILGPLMLIGMLLIKLDDGGPIFFKQERATLNGRIFNVLKLRTMCVGATAKSATLNDSRITRVGKFLRKSRIDEIPQLWNVFSGDMSLVGPRPEMIKNVNKYTRVLPEFEYRLRMKAGLTGYAQIVGKYNTTPKDKLLMDMMYIEQFSIWKDIQLILQTVIVLLKMDTSTEGFDGNTGKAKYKFVKYGSEEN